MTADRNPTISRPLSWLQQQSQQMAADLETLCNLNSGSENVEGLHRVADWLVDYFSPLGVEAQNIVLPSYFGLDDAGQTVERATGPALRWDFGPSISRERPLPETKSLLLSIHYDTVYETSNPFQNCTRMHQGRMQGPGVIDAKGGIVILRYAVWAAQQFLDLSRHRLCVVLTPDEEIGSPSSIHLWKRIAAEFDFAFLFEPAMADGSLVSGRKGTGNFVIVVRGQAAHSGRNFSAGRNALVHASRLILELHALNGLRPNVTLNVGRVRGGGAVNVVPDLAVVRVNVRVASSEDQQWLETQVQQLVRKYHLPDDGFQVQIEGGIHAPPKSIDGTIRQWMLRVETEAKALGQSITWQESGGASDGNKLQALGLPNIDTFGPDGDGLHSDHEWIDLTSLPRKASLVYRLLEQWIDGRDDRVPSLESQDLGAEMEAI